jgi:exosortase E/protease (VPEID-CTERM system)
MSGVASPDVGYGNPDVLINSREFVRRTIEYGVASLCSRALPYNLLVDWVQAIRSLAGRIISLALLFTIEALIASTLLDGDSPVPAAEWLAAGIHTAGSPIAKFVIALSALVATFAALRYRKELKPLASMVLDAPIRWELFAAHFAAMGLFAAASSVVYGQGWPSGLPNIAAAIWIFAVLCAIPCAALAVIPRMLWVEVRRATGRLFEYATTAALLTSLATGMLRSLWGPASRLTFRMVQLILSPIVPDMVIQPENMRIGTHRFTAVISSQCSGLEGIGLLLVFGCIWLLLFRDEARFPHAVVLLPLGMVALFVLNSFRIAALIMIGTLGARKIAAEGFHSQAGWIAFNSVAFAGSAVARRWKWILREEHKPAVTEGSNPTAAFLVPFLAILAAAMLSRAASAGFEWLYSLRLVAALLAIWIYRRSYERLDWKVGWIGPSVGAAVFILWTGVQQFRGGAIPMPQDLAGMAAPLRSAWIAGRIAGAVVTVPLAEELAFRGYLLRRFTAADFENVRFQSTTWFAVLASSIFFGIMHGGAWAVGILAGAAYAAVIRRTGRMGDAVAAHATTNALLAIYVLAFGQWQLW